MDLTGKTSRYQRRTLVVFQRAQYALVIYLLLVSSLVAGFNLLVTMLWAYLFRMDTGYMPMPRGRLVLAGCAIGLGAVTVVASSIYGALYLSNKLAGPVWRLNQFMKDAVEKGSRRRLSFRKGDQFTEVAETYNRLIEHLERVEAGARPENGESE